MRGITGSAPFIYCPPSIVLLTFTTCTFVSPVVLATSWDYIGRRCLLWWSNFLACVSGKASKVVLEVTRFL